MDLRPAFAAVACVALLTAGSLARAEDYRADEYLSLDLSKAVLSPKPLGPPAQFAPVAIEARSDARTDQGSEADWARGSLKVEPRSVAVQNVKVAPPHHVFHVASSQPKAAARVKLAHRRNPLDAQAMDTRIQTWPCRSGGICNWKQ